ncbi:M48 family metalloprotease [Arthrobacter sp. MSA 4-2]|uniref:M48 family metalloprotease n=1 Tax=Arthrobacter sp. MSA 4-2 TaxID=2794349 RepID=UPI0018E7B856|nr:M48 family metalloprotease [Arthrobacter sp. MSA 4-2]MBJ2122535.1 M48 family metalloprotease [Arthrobacter sp. MSA 4-2]
MDMSRDRYAIDGYDELQKAVRKHVARISGEEGLQVPEVSIVRSVGPGPSRADAYFAMPQGVPTIEVTERALRELSVEGLTFLLAHELGHLADAAWCARRTRVLVAVFSLAGVLMLGGFLAGALAGYFNASSLGGVAALVTGVVTLGVWLLMVGAMSREGEVRADMFALRHDPELIGARTVFDSWGADKPDPSGPMTLRRRVSYLFRTRPDRSTRLRTMQAAHFRAAVNGQLRCAAA